MTDTITAEDPYLWLEDVTGDDALGLGARAQRRDARRRWPAGDRFDALRTEIRRGARLRRPDPVHRQARATVLYNFWRDAAHPRGLWRRTTLDEYRKAEPAWEVAARPRRAGRGRGRELGLARRDGACGPSTERCLSALSRGGADAVVVREFDLADKRLRRRTASRCPRRRARSAGSTPTASTSAPTSGPGSMTARATRASSSSGGAARRCRRPRWSSRASRTTSRSAPSTTRRRASSATSSSAPMDFYRSETLPARRRRRAGPRSTCPTTPDVDVHREWLLDPAAHAVDGRRHDLPGRRAARRRLRRFLRRRARVRRAVRARRRAPSLDGYALDARPPDPQRCWTTSRAGWRC